MFKNIVFLLLMALSFHANAAPVENFHKVTDGIYRGARPVDQLEIAKLAKMGIKTVINLQGGDLNSPWIGDLIPYFEDGETKAEINQEGRIVNAYGMNYYSMPLNSLGTVSKREAIRIEQVLEIMNDPEQQPVFVHCAHGADRTGMVIALYRVKYQNWSTRRAHNEMQNKGHNWLHMLFTSGMDEYFLSYAFMLSVERALGIAENP